MTKEQQKTVQYLESLGYTITLYSLWPVMEHPDTGVRLQVDFTGAQKNMGYTR